MTIDEMCDYLEDQGLNRLRNDSGYNLGGIIAGASCFGYYLSWDEQHCSDGIFRSWSDGIFSKKEVTT